MQLSGKNILIFTTDTDKTTNKVIKFLRNKFNILRVNDIDWVDIAISNVQCIEIKLNNSYKLNEQNIHKIWYRTGNVSRNVESKIPILKSINSKEQGFFKEFVFYYLESRFNFLGSITSEFTLNKLITLAKASENGLSIPCSTVSNHREIVINKENNFVKSVTNITPFEYDGYKYAPAYSMLPQSTYYSNSISFYQDYIDKAFEVRSYYLHGEFYSMAIFSQKNLKTKLDYRNYDSSNPNRNVPFKLPAETEEKLRSLMTDLNLNTGSIDLIYSKAGEFVFLEVNPTGQTDWLSVDCNYYLERKIARYLDET